MKRFSKTKRRAMKVALAIAYKIYRSNKKSGFARRTKRRLPKQVRRYLAAILKANKISNPPTKNILKKARKLQTDMRNLKRIMDKTGRMLVRIQKLAKKKGYRIR